MSTRSDDMAENLAGQVAIMTGGGRGFGQEVAKGLGAAGAAVTVTSHTQSQLNETVSAIEAPGGKPLGVAQDVKVQTDWEHILAATEAQQPVPSLEDRPSASDRTLSAHSATGFRAVGTRRANLFRPATTRTRVPWQPAGRL
jgi:NAD(P)-dependent dehydrogenase (short-subunit alcohol dehydrogenase family)